MAVSNFVRSILTIVAMADVKKNTFPSLLVNNTVFFFNPFVPNAPFLYPPENIRKPHDFLMFSGGRERVHWELMG